MRRFNSRCAALALSAAVIGLAGCGSSGGSGTGSAGTSPGSTTGGVTPGQKITPQTKVTSALFRAVGVQNMERRGFSPTKSARIADCVVKGLLAKGITTEAQAASNPQAAAIGNSCLKKG